MDARQCKDAEVGIDRPSPATAEWGAEATIFENALSCTAPEWMAARHTNDCAEYVLVPAAKDGKR